MSSLKRFSSKFLKTVALFYMAYPVTYLGLAALLFDIPAQQCIRILISPSFWLLSVISVAAGYGLWEMKRWAWYIYLLSNVLTGYGNAVLVSDFGESHHKIGAFLLSVLFPVLFIFRVGREVRVPYFLPKIRWWESDPRYRLIVPVSIHRKDGTPLEGEILDLSLGGCFIKLRTELDPEEEITLRFTVFGQTLSCAGNVVWRTQSAVTHPKGVGIKFLAFDRTQKKIMRAMNQRLREIASLYRSSRYLMSQEDFFKKMEKLQTDQLEITATQLQRPRS